MYYELFAKDHIASVFFRKPSNFALATVFYNTFQHRISKERNMTFQPLSLSTKNDSQLLLSNQDIFTYLGEKPTPSGYCKTLLQTICCCREKTFTFQTGLKSTIAIEVAKITKALKANKETVPSYGKIKKTFMEVVYLRALCDKIKTHTLSHEDLQQLAARKIGIVVFSRTTPLETPKTINSLYLNFKVGASLTSSEEAFHFVDEFMKEFDKTERLMKQFEEQQNAQKALSLHEIVSRKIEEKDQSPLGKQTHTSELPYPQPKQIDAQEKTSISSPSFHDQKSEGQVQIQDMKQTPPLVDISKETETKLQQSQEINKMSLWRNYGKQLARNNSDKISLKHKAHAHKKDLVSFNTCSLTDEQLLVLFGTLREFGSVLHKPHWQKFQSMIRALDEENRQKLLGMAEEIARPGTQPSYLKFLRSL